MIFLAVLRGRDAKPRGLAYVRPVVFALAVLMMACGGDNPAGPTGGSGSGSGSGGSGGSGGTRGTVTATVDGVAYTGAVNAASVNPSGNLNVASNNAALTLSVNFAARAAVGTTNINSTSTTVMNVITTNGTTVTGSWAASALGGSGSLTIATLTSSSVSGTFSFTALPASAGTVGTKTVTNGSFNATF